MAGKGLEAKDLFRGLQEIVEYLEDTRKYEKVW
jgi:hypothetical protein